MSFSGELLAKNGKRVGNRDSRSRTSDEEIVRYAPEPPVRAERFRAALQLRTLGRAGLGRGRNYRAILLERGSATLRANSGERRLNAPAMGWFPWSGEMRLELDAGAQGTHLLLTPSALDRSLRNRAEAQHLRYLAETDSVLRLTEGDSAAASISTCFAGILEETLHPGPLSSAIVDSLLHVLLILQYRGRSEVHGTSPSGGEAPASSLAARFVALVEAHFREQLRVGDYARRLGISPDRLHDVCTAAYGRTPGSLIRARVSVEARKHLENAPLSIGQIAGLLGFATPAQFNRFFSKQVGEPPGRYRSQRQAATESGSSPSAPYAWP